MCGGRGREGGEGGHLVKAVNSAWVSKSDCIPLPEEEKEHCTSKVGG